jgi:hypothetical protein
MVSIKTGNSGGFPAYGPSIFSSPGVRSFVRPAVPLMQFTPLFGGLMVTDHPASDGTSYAMTPTTARLMQPLA